MKRRLKTFLLVFFVGFIDFDHILSGKGHILCIIQIIFLVIQFFMGGHLIFLIVHGFEACRRQIMFFEKLLFESDGVFGVFEGCEGEVYHPLSRYILQQKEYLNLIRYVTYDTYLYLGKYLSGANKPSYRNFGGYKIQLSSRTHKMSSEFDVTVAFLQDVYKQASLDSQKLQAEMRHLRQQLEQMQKSIESKTEGIRRQMTPRIQQLEEKMNNSWGSIEQMNKLAQEELQRQRQIFVNCEKIVKEMGERIDGVQEKV